jgi:hypothetical protein
MQDETISEELNELRHLAEVKELYGWEDDNKKYKKRLKAIEMKYMPKISTETKTGKLSVAPSFTGWETIDKIKTDSFDKAYEKLEKINPGPWKSDKYSRGGLVTFNKSKNCPWRRRMKEDGSMFARIVQEGHYMHIQEGIIVHGEELDDDADQEAKDDDNGDDDLFESSSPSGKKASPKKSPKSKAKSKKQKAAEEPTVEEAAPAKRQRPQRPAKRQKRS